MREQSRKLCYTTESGKLALESDVALKSQYAMDGTIHTEKKEVKQKENTIENENTIYKGQILVFWRSMKEN